MFELLITERPGEIVIRDLVELELNKDQVTRNFRQLRHRVAVELGPRFIGLVASVVETGIGANPAHQFRDLLVRPDDFRQLGPVAAEARNLALVSGLQARRHLPAARDILLDRRRVGSGIEIGKVPFRHLAQVTGTGPSRARRLSQHDTALTASPLGCGNCVQGLTSEREEDHVKLRLRSRGRWRMWRAPPLQSRRSAGPRIGSRPERSRTNVH